DGRAGRHDEEDQESQRGRGPDLPGPGRRARPLHDAIDAFPQARTGKIENQATGEQDAERGEEMPPARDRKHGRHSGMNAAGPTAAQVECEPAPDLEDARRDLLAEPGLADARFRTARTRLVERTLGGEEDGSLVAVAERRDVPLQARVEREAEA